LKKDFIFLITTTTKICTIDSLSPIHIEPSEKSTRLSTHSGLLLALNGMV